MNLCGWIGLAKEIAAFKSFELLLFPLPILNFCKKLNIKCELILNSSRDIARHLLHMFFIWNIFINLEICEFFIKNE